MNEDGKVIPFLDSPGGKQIGEATLRTTDEGVEVDVELDESMKIDFDKLPEWLGGIADKSWDELDDDQKQWFENYQAYLDEVHKVEGLVVARKAGRTQQLMELMAETQKEAAEQIQEAKKTIHFMSYDKSGSKGPGVYCSCGMSKIHNRGKVLAAWADKHFNKYGHYWKRT